MKIALTLLVLVLVLGAGTLLGVSIYFSNQIIEVPDFTTPVQNTPVLDVTAGTVTLQRTGDDVHPGTFELEWARGAALLGPVLSIQGQRVTRQLLHVEGQVPLSAGMTVFWTRYVYSGQLRDELDLPLSDVRVPTALGAMPAWYVPGRLSTWAVLVHGRGASRDEPLRVFAPLAALGLPLLSISYRNDIGAPASSDGANHLGDSEWQDLEAAVRYALAHGARHIILYGWSQGGSVVEVFLHHSSLARDVQALVLDSPILNWKATLAFQAQQRGVPGFIASSAELVTTLRNGTSFDDLDQSNQAQPDLPILLFHGVADSSTPVAVSDAFARAHADLVTYIRLAGIEHVEGWNADPQTYDGHLTAFLQQKLGL